MKEYGIGNNVKSLGNLHECLSKFQKTSDPEASTKSANELRADVIEAMKTVVDILSNEKYGLNMSDVFAISHAMEAELRNMFLAKLITLAQEFNFRPEDISACLICAESTTTPPEEFFKKHETISGNGEKGALYGRTEQEDRNTD